MIGEADYLGAELATSMARWDRTTAQHGLRALLNAYDLTDRSRETPPVAGPGDRS